MTVVTHDFEQDPAETAVLCKTCGMWPQHHNHVFVSDENTVYGFTASGEYVRCVCADCIHNADDLP